MPAPAALLFRDKRHLDMHTPPVRTCLTYLTLRQVPSTFTHPRRRPNQGGTAGRPPDDLSSTKVAYKSSIERHEPARHTSKSEPPSVPSARCSYFCSRSLPRPYSIVQQLSPNSPSTNSYRCSSRICASLSIMIEVDWKGLILPFAYVLVLLGAFTTFSTIYRKRKAGESQPSPISTLSCSL